MNGLCPLSLTNLHRIRFLMNLKLCSHRLALCTNFMLMKIAISFIFVHGIFVGAPQGIVNICIVMLYNNQAAGWSATDGWLEDEGWKFYCGEGWGRAVSWAEFIIGWWLWWYWYFLSVCVCRYTKYVLRTLHVEGKVTTPRNIPLHKPFFAWNCAGDETLVEYQPKRTMEEIQEKKNEK